MSEARDQCPFCLAGQLTQQTAGRQAADDPYEPIVSTYSCGHQIRIFTKLRLDSVDVDGSWLARLGLVGELFESIRGTAERDGLQRRIDDAIEPYWAGGGEPEPRGILTAIVPAGATGLDSAIRGAMQVERDRLLGEALGEG